MIENTANTDEKYEQVFFPNSYRRFQAAKEAKTRFVHYTSAEAAMKIISGEEVWMRQVSTMNDVREVNHGLDYLVAMLKGGGGKFLREQLEISSPGIYEAVLDRFYAWAPSFRYSTYITSISEHCKSEDTYGRLSMWRAYGGTTGVALVLNSDPLFSTANPLKAYTSPVEYLSERGFAAEFATTAHSLGKESEYLKSLPKETVINAVFQALRFAALCTKHPGFGEEREWRIIYSPQMELSDHITEYVVSLNGVPQIIQKIPLKNIPEENFHGAAISELIDRVIIGPTQFPNAIYQAFYSLLMKAGIENPEEKIVTSDIPLRT